MNAKKIVLYGVLPLAAITGGFFIYKYFKNKSEDADFKDNQKQDKPKGQEPVKTNDGQYIPTPSVDKQFPLKVGSRNDYVKELQDALGVTIDGIFGTKETLPALQEQTGKSQINSYEELQAVIEQIQKQDEAAIATQATTSEIAKRKERANSILSKYTGYGDDSSWSSSSKLLFLADSTLRGYDWDSISDQYISNGYYINRKKGVIISAVDYRPYFVTQDGYLMLYCPTGANEGYWKVNPNDITVQ